MGGGEVSLMRVGGESVQCAHLHICTCVFFGKGKGGGS